MSKFDFLSPDDFLFDTPDLYPVKKNRYGEPIIFVVEDKEGNKYLIDEYGKHKKIKNPLYMILNKKRIEVITDTRIKIIRENPHIRNAEMTDFAILLGGIPEYRMYPRHENGRIFPKFNFLWLKRNDSSTKEVFVVASEGIRKDISDKNVVARPITKYSMISSDVVNSTTNKDGILEVEYGEYPQLVVFEDFSKILETNYQNGILKETGKIYTTNSADEENWNSLDNRKFKEKQHIEYEYKGKKYIRFVADYSGVDKKLSDGRIVKLGEVYWIEVSPVKWLVDKTDDIALSKDAIFAGISREKEKNMENKQIKIFLKNYFEKDIIPSGIKKQGKQKKGKQLSLLIDEIKTYLLPNEKQEKTLKEINDLVVKYNKDLEEMSKRIKNDEILPVTLVTPDSLYQDLYTKLSIILDKVKKEYNEQQHYYDIINILDTIISMINENKSITTNNDIINTFKTIIDDIIPLISIKNNLKEDILKELLEEKIKIENLIKNNDFSRYKDINEWEIDIRKKIENILLNIINVNNKQNAMEIINQYLSENLPKVEEGYFERLIASYLQEITRISQEINKMTYEQEYLIKLEQILSFDIDESESLEEIIAYLSLKIIELNKLHYEIANEQQVLEEIDDFKISL